jgi:hypothetical protein
VSEWRWRLVLLAVCATACTETRTVEGTWTLRYATADGVTEEPRDLSGVEFAAIVGRGEEGEIYAGVGFADGRFRIEDVPDGNYLLVWQDTAGNGAPLYGKTEHSNHVAYDTMKVGRSDAVLADPALEVPVALEGMSPWQILDQVFLTSPDVGVHQELGDIYVAAESGATALTTDIFWWDHLIEPGDDAYVTQVVTRDGPVPYRALDRVYRTSGLDLASVGPEPWTIELETVSPDSALPLDVMQFALGEAVRPAHPGVDTPFVDLAVQALPRWRDHGIDKVAPILLAYRSPAFNEVHAALPYGDPFPATWDRFVTWAATAGLAIDEPDVTRPARLIGGLGRATALELHGAATTQPLVTPPRALRINGADATIPLAGVGTGPHVSWEPPVSGDPTTYVVSVFAITHDVEGNEIDGELVRAGSFQTTDTSLDLPPELLDPRGRYILRVTVFAGTPTDHGWAAALSSPFTP